MLEEALLEELNKIQEFKGDIYPTNIPEGTKPPMLIYILSNYNQVKTLSGPLDNEDKSILFNVLCKKYGQMKELTDVVKHIITGFSGKRIGSQQIYIQDVQLLGIAESFENEIKLYRGIIDVKFYY